MSLKSRSLKFKASALGAVALAATLAACGSSSKSTSANGTSNIASQGTTASSSAASSSGSTPTVTLMVGGIDKQIYLEYQLAQDLGLFKKYGVNMVLSTEQAGGVGAEDAMAAGQVDMAGAWYVHTIDFQAKGKQVEDVVNLGVAPGERVMCAKGTNITSPAQWKGKNIGVTDLGSGTDELIRYMAAQQGLTTKDFTRVGVGAGSTFVAALQHGRITCGITSQPTVAAVEKLGIGYPAFDLSSAAGAQKWLGGTYPAAGVLALTSWVNSHQDTVQRVVDALVATMHWISTHNATDIANNMPPNFVDNGVTTKADYIAALSTDMGQFGSDGTMPSDGPPTVLKVEQFVGNVTTPVNLSETYTDTFVAAANKLEGYSS
jgi:NitT/TauT family transport system substrate-binding protein